MDRMNIVLIKIMMKIYDELNKHNDEMLEAQELDANIILNQAEIFLMKSTQLILVEE